MRQTILARRYAKALFSLGKQQDNYEAYNEALTAIADLMHVSPEVGDSLTNPLYPLEARKKIMAKIASLVKGDAILTAFLNLLVERQRADILPDIALEM
ncbi:MAG: F0F1 ATP synthase subunit delta, partial [Desulfobulbaceae bacterium]|nr:F0F1 ATP synthase subunit delta [Desulfobulbaceae bacterium]